MLIKEAISVLKECGIEIKKVNKDGEISCLCPLHNDSSPSLAVNAFTGKYQCFAGCMKGKSIEDLVYKVTGKTLTSKILMPIKIEIENKEIIPTIPDLPLALNNSGYEYLSNRKIADESIKKWKIMWWEDRKSIVIPISNIGFVTRTVVGHKEYKYVYGTKINNGLFGYEQFNTELKSAILVEGCLDAIYLHSLGFTNSLAVLHADISDNQIKLLKKLRVYVINILMDNDEGGNTGAEKIKYKLKNDFIVKIKKLPIGKDPNDCNYLEIMNALKGE